MLVSIQADAALPQRIAESAGAAAEQFDGRTLAEWQALLKRIDPSDPGSRQYVPGLRLLVTSREVPLGTRSQAALTLGRLGQTATSALDDLVATFTDVDEDPELRAQVLKSISFFGPAAAATAPSIISWIGSDKSDAMERAAGFEALGQIGARHPVVVPYLMQAVEHPESSVRLQAIRALGLAGAAAAPAVPLLIRVARDEDSSALRREAVRALEVFGEQAESAIPVLVELLVADSDEAVRDAAARALPRTGPRAIPMLVRLLEQPDVGVRLRAARSLGTLGRSGRAALPALELRMDDPDAATRLAAVAAHWQISKKPDAGRQALLQSLQSGDRQIRRQAVQLYREQGAAAADQLPAIVALQRDSRAHVRLAAEKAAAAIREAIAD